MEMKIELFVPPAFSYAKLDLKHLQELTGKQFFYASKGRHAIGHILNALRPENNIVLVSPYMCDSVFEKLKQMKMQIEYYDIDPVDLNPSVASIENRIVETGAATVIAASLYGNPADMEKIEKVCKQHNVVLIDDAAQSFGTLLNGRYIGCFGNAGLFAFSPGKATAGHMGALYWTEKKYDFKHKNHYFAHKTAWWDFKYNRLYAYSSFNIKKRVFSKINLLVQKFSNIENDGMEKFEDKILGGILSAQLDGSLNYRNLVHDYFCTKYSDTLYFRIIKGERGSSRHTKIVLIFNSCENCKSFKNLLNKRQICFFPGYDLSEKQFDTFIGCSSVRNCIVELPIESDKEHMKYIEETIDTWLEINNQIGE